MNINKIISQEYTLVNEGLKENSCYATLVTRRNYAIGYKYSSI